jgi:hypothetical protein
MLLVMVAKIGINENLHLRARQAQVPVQYFLMNVKRIAIVTFHI